MWIVPQIPCEPIQASLARHRLRARRSEFAVVFAIALARAGMLLLVFRRAGERAQHLSLQIDNLDLNFVGRLLQEIRSSIPTRLLQLT